MSTDQTRAQEWQAAVHTDHAANSVAACMRKADQENAELRAKIARVEALADTIARHIEKEPESVEYRHHETGVWHDVADDLRAAVSGGA